MGHTNRYYAFRLTLHMKEWSRSPLSDSVILARNRVNAEVYTRSYLGAETALRTLLIHARARRLDSGRATRIVGRGRRVHRLADGLVFEPGDSSKHARAGTLRERRRRNNSDSIPMSV